jgi:hypothetical protein
MTSFHDPSTAADGVSDQLLRLYFKDHDRQAREISDFLLCVELFARQFALRLPSPSPPPKRLL